MQIVNRNSSLSNNPIVCIQPSTHVCVPLPERKAANVWNLEVCFCHVPQNSEPMQVPWRQSKPKQSVPRQISRYLSCSCISGPWLFETECSMIFFSLLIRICKDTPASAFHSFTAADLDFLWSFRFFRGEAWGRDELNWGGDHFITLRSFIYIDLCIFVGAHILACHMYVCCVCRYVFQQNFLPFACLLGEGGRKERGLGKREERSVICICLWGQLSGVTNVHRCIMCK